MRINELDTFEAQSESRLRDSIKALNPDNISPSRFYEILLQRYWISQEFTYIYDIALDRLTSKSSDAQETIRRIIREEYPVDDRGWRTPSHREDLVADLRAIGVSERHFLNSRPSTKTTQVIAESRRSVLSYGRSENADISLLAFLRFWGEVLTATEYTVFWPRIKRLLQSTESRFYEYHMNHDQKNVPLHAIDHRTDLTTHADKIGQKLQELICKDRESEETMLALALSATKKATLNKIKFYQQFMMRQ